MRGGVFFVVIFVSFYSLLVAAASSPLVSPLEPSLLVVPDGLFQVLHKLLLWFSQFYTSPVGCTTLLPGSKINVSWASHAGLFNKVDA